MNVDFELIQAVSCLRACSQTRQDALTCHFVSVFLDSTGPKTNCSLGRIHDFLLSK